MRGIGIDVLYKEHDNILKFIDIVQQEALKVMNGAEINIKRFREFIDFSRNYADKHHHGKEELILFKFMVDELGTVAEKLVKHGMLVEHDLGRLYVKTLEDSLNEYEVKKDDYSKMQILSNAVCYGNLLKRHIDKENNAVFTFAEKQLNEEVLKQVDSETAIFEDEEKEQREFYENWLNSF